MTGTCAVPGCGRPLRSRGWCASHYRRWQRHGNAQPDRPVASRTSQPGGYWSLRRRLVGERGPAADYRCADCAAMAACWSYDGGDPDERVDLVRGVRYSMDLDRYRPRCRFCHRQAVRAVTDPLTAARRAAPGLDPDRAACLYEAGATCRGIGALMGVSPDAVARALRTLDVPLRPSGRNRRPEPAISTHNEENTGPDQQPEPKSTTTPELPENLTTRTTQDMNTTTQPPTRPMHPDRSVTAAGPDGPPAPEQQ
jgi:hypothetical protein